MVKGKGRKRHKDGGREDEGLRAHLSLPAGNGAGVCSYVVMGKATDANRRQFRDETIVSYKRDVSRCVVVADADGTNRRRNGGSGGGVC